MIWCQKVPVPPRAALGGFSTEESVQRGVHHPIRPARRRWRCPGSSSIPPAAEEDEDVRRDILQIIALLLLWSGGAVSLVLVILLVPRPR
jgi:hypothetical protein